MSEAKPQPAPLKTLCAASPQAAAPRSAPSQAPIAAPPPAPPAQAASQPASQAAQPQAAAQAASPATQQQDASQSPASAADQLPVSAPPSAQASAAAAAAAADLKTLQEQIAANPPSGSASPPTAANRGSAASTDFMPPSQYLGQTFDLFGDQSASPQPTHQSPASIRRRAAAPRRGIPGINNRLRRPKELGRRRRGAVNDPRDQGVPVGNPRPSFSPPRQLVLSGWDSLSWRAQGRRTKVRSPPQ